MKPILFIDWGIGGLSVLKYFHNFSTIYISDSGFEPYGKLNENELTDRLSYIFDSILDKHSIEAIVIACNAASTAFIGTKYYKNIPLFNVIEPTSNYLNASRFSKLCLIGGRRTIESGIYSKLARKTLELDCRIAQPLSALIEDGILNGSKLESLLEEILVGVDSKLGFEGIVLACTHYPAINPLLSLKRPGLQLIDPAKIVYEFVKINLPSNEFFRTNSWGEKSNSELTKKIFFTSGEPEKLKASAKLAFNFEIENLFALGPAQ